jgi:hypothetical protein
MDKQPYRPQGRAEATKKPTFGSTLDEFRKRLGRIEKHLIDLKEAMLPEHEDFEAKE